MADDQRMETEYEVEEEREHVAEEDDTDWADYVDEGAITLLLVVGVALFLFPEPGTSALGMLLVAAGVGGWIVDVLN